MKRSADCTQTVPTKSGWRCFSLGNTRENPKFLLPITASASNNPIEKLQAQHLFSLCLSSPWWQLDVALCFRHRSDKSWVKGRNLRRKEETCKLSREHVARRWEKPLTGIWKSERNRQNLLVLSWSAWHYCHCQDNSEATYSSCSHVCTNFIFSSSTLVIRPVFNYITKQVLTTSSLPFFCARRESCQLINCEVLFLLSNNIALPLKPDD